MTLVASCAGANKMKAVYNINVDCTPEVLATVGESHIPVDLNLTFPKGYFNPNAIVTFTPAIVFEGGEEVAPEFTYQGERVYDNYKVIEKTGGTASEHFDFHYIKGMEVSRLELRGKVTCGNKSFDLPAIKVADGLNTTARLACKQGEVTFKADEYQDIIHKRAEGQILFDVNSSAVKSSELRSESILTLQEALREVSEDSRYTMKDTKVIAYASPEGGETYNAILSDKRAVNAEGAWKTILDRNNNRTTIETRSIGQDWEGFREAVANSNISDKDLILRVLSMYSDPAIREREIRNMSQVYTEINKKVFPELRRARIIADADYQNFTDAELDELAKKAIEVLDEEGLLRVAANSKDASRKKALYKRAAESFGSDRAYYNLASLALQEGRTAEAEACLAKMKKADKAVANSKGVCEMQNGNLEAAVIYLQKSNLPEATKNLGTTYILQGNYAEAARTLAGTGSCNECLAYILNDQLDKAESVSKGCCPQSSYLKAIIAARKGDAEGVKAALEAVNKDEALKARAEKDIEFAAYR